MLLSIKCRAALNKSSKVYIKFTFIQAINLTFEGPFDSAILLSAGLGVVSSVFKIVRNEARKTPTSLKHLSLPVM